MGSGGRSGTVTDDSETFRLNTLESEADGRVASVRLW